jgi:uncharacterized protein
VDRHYKLNGFDFVWDHDKARLNVKNHGIHFEEACEVCFDPFYVCENASRHQELRWGMTGYSESDRMLYVVATELDDEAWRIISARNATNKEKRRYEKTNAGQ